MNSIFNILINTKGNNVRLADIYFNEKIESIIFKSDEIDWDGIDSYSKSKKLFNVEDNKISTDSKPDFINGDFNLLIPGAIDPHVHFNTPGFEFRDDFEHASRAAAFGGVTTIIDMPCTSLPPVTNLENFNVKLNELHSRSLIDFAFWGGISGTDFNDLSKVKKQINDLSEAGIAGFKVYVISGMKDFTDLTYEQIEETAYLVKQTNKPLAVHAEDKSTILARREYCKKKNMNSWADYCSARNAESERIAVSRLIKIAERTECRIHIVHLSSKLSLDLISEARKKGISITSETCPHYLQFTQNDFENIEIRNFLKTAPPVKHIEDQNALWKGLKNNELEFVTTDHAGCNPDKEKTSNNFWEVYGGIPSVEFRVPYLLSEGFLKKRLNMQQTINLLSTNAAKFFKLENKGEIIKGKDADFALVDLFKSEKIDSKNMHSKGKYSPFNGMVFNSIVQKTFLRGEIIMNRSDNSFGNIGYGKFIKL